MNGTQSSSRGHTSATAPTTTTATADATMMHTLTTVTARELLKMDPRNMAKPLWACAQAKITAAKSTGDASRNEAEPLM